MQHSPVITFGGSDLDRAAHLRTDPAALARTANEKRTIVLWRGKPLVDGDPADGLVEVCSFEDGHAILKPATEAEIFLGLLDGVAYFAQDISAWEPVEPVDEAQIGAFLDPSLQTHPSAPETAHFRELRAIMTALTPRDAELAATARALITWHRSHGFCAKCGSKTQMAQAGWQRVCPSCGAHHFPRTDPVVIMLITYGDSVLVGRSPGWPEGMYSLLAGFVEPGETVEAAVRREVWEETGVPVGTVRYLASQPWPFPASLMMGCWGQATDTKITIDPDEIEAARWLTRAELLEVFAGTHPEVKPARRGAIAHALLQGWLADRMP